MAFELQLISGAIVRTMGDHILGKTRFQIYQIDKVGSVRQTNNLITSDEQPHKFQPFVWLVFKTNHFRNDVSSTNQVDDQEVEPMQLVASQPTSQPAFSWSNLE